MLGIDGLEANTRELLCQVYVGVCGYVPSCQALNDTASQEPGGRGACLVLESPWVVRRYHNDQLGGKIMSVCDRGGRPSTICS
jgi:hypothetical protein